MTPLARTESILSELIAHPSVSAVSNLEIIDDLATRLEAIGARVSIWHDETGSKANLWATLGPDGPGGIVLSGHTDVVPVEGQDWSTDPFVLTERDGRLFGRGTCDMKGFLAATLAIAPDWAARPLTRPLHFSFTYDEEVGCLGARRLVPELARRGIKPAMVIVGEPTSMQIIEGHKGCCEYTTRFAGLEGHGSAPDKGVNAAAYAARYVARLLDLAEELKSRAPAGSRFDPPWTTINIGRLSGGTVHNVIPSKAEVDWEMRPVEWSDADFVNEAMNRFVETELLPAMRTVTPQASITTDTIGEVVGLEPRKDNPARDLLHQLTGGNACDVVPFGTEAGLFQQMGTSVVVCGPGSIAQAHKPDEFITRAQLQKCLDMLVGLERYLTA
ncbi:acetylornithine deacetylase [Pacificoceanicola onchidii]|uniref:acetylornithine deacetylase n=1 Tax=Pacificoceanicola onchidii TaxID=2562685 RepID=UPI0010A62371|nr:acetylornithine deacetylase [Pacificoceanicola onchidii]